MTATIDTMVFVEVLVDRVLVFCLPVDPSREDVVLKPEVEEMHHKVSKQKLLYSRLFLPVFFVMVLMWTVPVQAREIPFPIENIITDTFDQANSIYAADINSDGALDVLGAATAADTIAWWQNNDGNGSVWTEVIIDDAFDGAEEAHPADVDGDGDLDVLGAARFGEEFAWWENSDGAGTTWNKTIISNRPQAMSIQGADMDRDGDIDVVGATYTNQEIYWWENDGGAGANWITHTVTLNSWGARHVRVADVDGDGDPDILSVALQANDISWWENSNGDGSTWIEHRLNDFFNEARSINAADLDGDGDIDIVGAAQAENRIAWWENGNGDGSLWIEHTVTTTFFGVRSSFPIDLDQDGDIDIVGAAFTANAVSWWENIGGDASAWVEHNVDISFGNAISAYAADLDGDGDPDILAAAELDDTLSWWPNETIHSVALYPQLFEHTIATDVDGSVFSLPADIDGDGDLDVLATGYDENVVSWWENTDGGAMTWSEHIIDNAVGLAYMTRAADMDRDGDLDIVGMAILGPNQLRWWENTDGIGTNWTTHIIATTSFNPARSFEIADLDNDGDLDVVAANVSSGFPLAWWENSNGDGTVWIRHLMNYMINRIMRPVSVADLDGDGDIDILSGDDFTNRLQWHENAAGDGLSWLDHQIDNNFQHVRFLEAVDMDRDGDLDLVASALVEDQIAWWENTTGDATTWTKHLVEAFFDGADMIDVVDIDFDGDWDVLGSALDADEFSWWENSGDNVTWTKHVLNGNSGNATSIVAVDMDRDGDLDILGAAFNDDNILWWENRGGQFGLATTDTSPLQMNAGTQDDMLRIVVTHNGRAGDHDLEMVTLELLLEEAATEPLSDTEANAILNNLEIYQDDGSGTFELANDTLVSRTDTFALTKGLLVVPFTDGDPYVQVSFGVPQTYFVVITLAPDLHTNPDTNNVGTLMITHVTESSSTAEDRDFDLPLSLAYAANVSASVDLLTPTAVTLHSYMAENVSDGWSTAFALMGLVTLALVLWQKRQ